MSSFAGSRPAAEFAFFRLGARAIRLHVGSAYGTTPQLQMNRECRRRCEQIASNPSPHRHRSDVDAAESDEIIMYVGLRKSDVV